jgi:hypothetical protein
MGVEKETLTGNNKTRAKKGCLMQLRVEATTTNLLHFLTMPSENVTTQRVLRSKKTQKLVLKLSNNFRAWLNNKK